jgi:hypothetical protein
MSMSRGGKDDPFFRARFFLFLCMMLCFDGRFVADDLDCNCCSQRNLTTEYTTAEAQNHHKQATLEAAIPTGCLSYSILAPPLPPSRSTDLRIN